MINSCKDCKAAYSSKEKIGFIVCSKVFVKNNEYPNSFYRDAEDKCDCSEFEPR